MSKKITLEDIKKFAEENFCNENTKIFGDDEEFAVTNPWIDHSGRFELTDEEAIAEWGLPVVMDFIIKAKRYLEAKNNATEKDPTLCGFVYCYGNKDFSCLEVDITKEDQIAIEKVLDKYDNDGTSERNVYDSKFSDVLREEY